MPESRLELRLLDVINHATVRTGAGWGKYPWGVYEAVAALLPLVNPADPAAPAIAKAWRAFTLKLND